MNFAIKTVFSSDDELTNVALNGWREVQWLVNSNAFSDLRAQLSQEAKNLSSIELAAMEFELTTAAIQRKSTPLFYALKLFQSSSPTTVSPLKCRSSLEKFSHYEFLELTERWSDEWNIFYNDPLNRLYFPPRFPGIRA